MDEESELTAAGTGGFFRAAAGCVVRRGASGRGGTLLLVSMVSTDFGDPTSLIASSTCSIKGDVGGLRPFAFGSLVCTVPNVSPVKSLLEPEQ